MESRRLHLWAANPRLQVVICSAYSDYSWEQMKEKLGARQQLLILKKPFDTNEVLQLAHALTDKWDLLLASHRNLEALEFAVQARTADLESTHRRLEDTERRLLHSQKIQALGRLAGGIAHEINNPLAYILSNLHFISDVVRELETPIELAKELIQASSAALEGADRIARIVRDVKVYDQTGSAPTRDIDLAAVIARSVAAVTHPATGRGTVSVDLGAPRSAFTSEEGLAQVLTNLLTNAVQAWHSTPRAHPTRASSNPPLRISSRKPPG